MTRRRPAPSAERIASSRVRTVARASSRLATLAQQISSTKPTTPRKSIDVRRSSRADQRVVQRLERDAAARVRLRELARQPVGDGRHVGVAPPRCVTPGFRRPIDLTGRAARAPRAERPDRMQRPDAGRGRAAANSFGTTPTTVYGVAIEPDVAADDARVGVEARAPEGLAQHDDVGALRVVGRQERAAGNRP